MRIARKISLRAPSSTRPLASLAADQARPVCLVFLFVLTACGGPADPTATSVHDTSTRRQQDDAQPASDALASDTMALDALADAGLADTLATPDAGTTDAGTIDLASTDLASADVGPLQPDPAPTGQMQPVAGQLSIHQLDLPIGLVPKLGEAAIIIGPDGTLTLLDVGNNNHDDEVREAVIALNTTVLTPKRGYPRQRGAREVEWMVLTHNHGDHIGAAAELLDGKGALQITRGVVHRGHVDLGAGANLKRWGTLCKALKNAQKGRNFGLCAAKTAPSCDPDKLSGVVPATGCAGLRWGKLDDKGDDAGKEPTWLDLGGGARLTLLAANGRCTGSGDTTGELVFGHTDSNEENGRSLVGLVTFGAFRYHFGGDLTGSGAKGEPDVETLLTKTSGPRFWGPLGVDVVHAHHHARKTSSNVTLVAALVPKDGRARNVVAGINGLYLGSPSPAVVQRFTAGGRLAGGRFWVTASPVGGATSKDAAELIVVDGEVRVRTFAGGQGYRVQGWGDGSQTSLPFASVRSGQGLVKP